MTPLEDSLRDYYTTKADELLLPDQMFDGGSEPDDALLTYISIGPNQRRRTPILLAAAASIALLVGAGSVVSRNGAVRNPVAVGGPTTATTVTSSPDQTPILAPTWLPVGYVLKGVADGDGSNSRPRSIIYRNPALPLGSPALTVNIGDSHPPNRAAALTVQGRPATIDTSNGTVTIFMTDPKGLGIDVTSRSLPIDELKAVAETIRARTANAADGIDISSLPAGFEVVLDRPEGTQNLRIVNLDYGLPGSTTESFLVGIQSGSSAADEDLAASFGKGEELNLRGHSAWDMSPTLESSTSGLAWMETPNLFITIMSKGLDDASVKRIAESLQPITFSEFSKMKVDHPFGSDLTAFSAWTAPEAESPSTSTTSAS